MDELLGKSMLDYDSLMRSIYDTRRIAKLELEIGKLGQQLRMAQREHDNYDRANGSNLIDSRQKMQQLQL